MALDLLPYLIASGAAGTGNTTLVLTGGDNGGWPALPGDTIVVAGGSGGAQPTGVTDSQGNTYTKAAGTGTSPASSVWTATAGANGLKATLTGFTADQLTVTYSGTAQAKQWIAMGCQRLSTLDLAATPTSGTSAAPSITSGTPAVAGELFTVLVLHSNAGGTINVPSGWHAIARNVTSGSNALASLFVKVNTGTSAVTFTGALTTSTTWTCQLISHRPAAQSLKGTVGASIFSGAYPGAGLDSFQAHDRFNDVVNRTNNALKRYLAEDSWPPPDNTHESVVAWTTGHGCLCVVSIKPRRAVGGGTTSSLAGLKGALTYWKNSGIEPQLVLGNEANINGAKGPFGDGSQKDWDFTSPYGTPTNTQAAQNYKDYFNYYAPTVVSAGLQAQYNPAISSSGVALTYMPDRLQADGWPLLCGVSIDYYFTHDYEVNHITMATTIAACDGMSPPCPVGIGEWGATDSADRPLTDTPPGTRADMVTWMDNQITAVLAARPGAGLQNLPVLWYANGTGNSLDYGQGGGIIAAYQRTFDALDPSGGGGAATVTGSVAVGVTATIAPVTPSTVTGTVAVGITFRAFTAAPTAPGDVEGKPAVADSLVLAGTIELLGGGIPSTHPDCEGAIFRLGRDYDLSAPQLTADVVGGLLLDGEVIASMRASNRHPRLPVVIMVPPTGDLGADRLTLAGARELLLRLAAQQNWTLTWTRDGGLPLVLDCQGVSATTIEYSVIAERNLVSAVELEFSAMPYGRSEDPEQILLNAPSQFWDQPPAPVTLDDFTAAPNWLTGDQAGFDTTAGNWVATTNCTIARSTAQSRTAPASLALTSSAAGNMFACSAAAGNWATQMMPCQPGDTVTVGAYSRAATSTRSVSVGADFYDGNGVFLSTAMGSSVTNTTSGWATHPTASVTAPGGTVWARVKLQVTSAGAAGEVHYFDDVLISRGVWSDVAPSEWVSSAVTPLTGQQSAKWTRRKGEHPVYDRALGAVTDITGRGKLSLWAGLASTTSAYQVWHKGSVSYSVTLTDGNAATLTFGVKMHGQVSALSTLPHWQHISIPIPQTAGFDFTSVTRYRVEVFNAQDPNSGQAVLQATLFLAGVQAVATSTGAAATRSGWFALPGIVGTARAPLALQLAPGLSSWATVTEWATAGTKSWTAPAGVSSIDKVECWGAGAGGAASNDQGWGGGGGGGGEYAMNRNVPVTPLSGYAPVVGAHGTGGTSTNPSNDTTGGGDSWFTGNAGNQTTADGGQAGFLSNFNGGGAGGSGSSAYLHHPGGDGFRANHEWDGTGGGGGGSGGTGAAGVDAGGQKGAGAVTGGGGGGDGGAKPLGSINAGQNGSAPGGGGGGGGLVRQDAPTPRRRGGDGADGKVRLTYGASGMLPLGSFLVHMPQVDAPAAFNPVCTVGNAADTPDGREYTVPQIGALAARFDGTYTVFLTAATWSSPSSPRTVTVQVRQYPYSGAGAIVGPALSRTLTPASDVTNGYVDMGAISLPLADLPPGNTDAYFTVGVTSTTTGDRFYDVLFIDSGGQLVLVNMPGTAWVNNAWIDEADRDRDLGRISGSDTDRDRARSLLAWADRVSGGPLSVTPDQDNRLLLYATQGVPGATAWYAPRWWTERLR